MTAYYNEVDPYAAQWLRNLINAGHIAPGDVDERSIADVVPTDLMGYTQCHFFAGIGVWSYALRKAGWSDGHPVWTGSCPCQPFSPAGRGEGFADERHLWPAWHHLISQCQPPVVFGEQVDSAPAKAWLDLVHTDMEAFGYAFGASVFPAASVGAPHRRHRTYFVANSNSRQSQHGNGSSQTQTSPKAQGNGQEGRGWKSAVNGCAPVFMANPSCTGLEGCDTRPLGDELETVERGCTSKSGLMVGSRFDWPGPTNGFWRDADWLHCRDGRWRPVEPGTFPLAHGAPARMGRLRAYGNAINAEAASKFIAAAMPLIPTNDNSPAAKEHAA